MSTGDTSAQHQSKRSYDSDNSSSSRSVFNSSDFQTIAAQAVNTQFNSIFSEEISSVVKTINYEQMHKLNSQIHFLEDKINDQNKTLNNQESEISNLRKTLGDLYDQMHHFKLNSAIYVLNKYDSHKKIDFYKSTSPTFIRHRHETTSPQIAQATSLYHDNMLPDDNQTRILQEALHKLNAALERRDARIDALKKKINELRQFQSNIGKATRISTTPSMHTLISSPKNSHASAFIPIVAIGKSQPVILPTNTFTSTMAFTMSLANVSRNFSALFNKKIDDKLRDVHIDNNINKQTSATVNNLYNDTQFNPSATTTATYHKNTSHNNSNDNFNYDNTQNHHADNKYSRTFLNSAALPSRSSQIQNKIQTHEQNSNRNTKQQQYSQQPNSLSRNSQQQNFDPQHQYQSSNQHELIHQQQQQQQQQYSSPFSSPQRSSMQKNI
ncbi:unnamed protein product [Rotaria magnacalcarata]|uniref:Uncharacterized protein n=1 Tax=Rotaria magnacalcarata TaxID=392030 RepID=A0A820H901_9BILA|nr:unnamed protein product [Rotaria magnacalcarata]